MFLITNLVEYSHFIHYSKTKQIYTCCVAGFLAQHSCPCVSLRTLCLWRYFSFLLPALPLLRGARDMCINRTWWLTKRVSPLISHTPEPKTNICSHTARSTCPVKSSVRLMFCQRGLLVAHCREKGGLTNFSSLRLVYI